jgi:hypothetical protein
MTPGQLVDFREQNKKHLTAFRRGMLKYAAKLDAMLKSEDVEHISERTKFLVKTEIQPVLDELRSDIQKSNRPWSVRAADIATIGGSITVVCLSSGIAGAFDSLARIADVVSKELQAAKGAEELRNKSDLYYLLEVERFTR